MIEKRKIILDLVKQSGALPEAEPAAFFVAGLPGSGKTEISKNLIKESGVKLLRIDMDEIAELLPDYKPEIADEFRKPSTSILSECFSYALHHKISFLMDGTFGSAQAIKNIERSLNHDFKPKIVYALQDPKIAWQFTLAREKVEHRAIKFEGFVEAYYKTINNLRIILDKYSDKVALDIAIKTSENKIGEWIRNAKFEQFDEMTNLNYNKDKLIKYITGA